MYCGASFHCRSQVLKAAAAEAVKEPAQRLDVVRRLIERRLTEHADPETHYQLLFAGVAALLSVVQSNYTGPSIPDAPEVVRFFFFLRVYLSSRSRVVL
jgi:hypothetical protein